MWVLGGGDVCESVWWKMLDDEVCDLIMLELL